MPNHWPLVPLGEVMRLDLHPVDVDPSVAYEMVGVLSFGRGLFPREPVQGANTSYRHFYRLDSHHVVMSQLFGWEGALAVSSPKYSGRFVSPQFPTFLCDNARLDKEFVGWLMRRKAFWEDLGSRTKGVGDRRRTLNPDALLACKIPLPPLDEQRRIVARIEALAAKIEEVRFVRQQQDGDVLRVLEGEYRRVIKGAETFPMDVVAPLIRRPIAVSPEESYPELGIRSFGKGTFHKPPILGTALGTKRIFRIETDDLLFNIVFAWEGAVAVARREDHGRVGSHRFLTCVPRRGHATSNFLRFHFLTDEGIEALGTASPGGAGRNRTLGLDALRELRVPVPPYDEQVRFDNLQAKVDALKKLQAETAAELDALLPSILDRAFKGEL